MIKLLVTGSEGQLGRCLQDVCERFKDKIAPVFIDYKDLDITDEDAVKSFFNAQDIDWVINAAAYTAVDKAEEESELAFKVNEWAVRNMASICAEKKARFIHISTDYVFDGTATTPYKTTEVTNPQSVYGKSKVQGEQAAMAINGEMMVVRTAWLYSAYGQNFLKTMLRLGAQRDELGVVNDQYGTPTSAHNLAEALIAVVLQNKAIKKTTIYHYTNRGATTWFHFADKIMELAQLPCKVRPITTAEYPTLAKRPAYSVLDTEDIARDFSLDICGWEEALREVIDRL